MATALTEPAVRTVFFKIGVLKYFATFIGKHPCYSLFLIKLQVRPAILLTRDSITGVFQ